MNSRGIMSILNESDSILPSVGEVEKAIPVVSSGVVVQPMFSGYDQINDHIPPMEITLPDSVSQNDTKPAITDESLPVEEVQTFRRLCKRGDVITYLDVKEGLEEKRGTVIAVQMLPVPSDYQLSLVRGEKRFDVVVHKADWLKMADGVRSVEGDALATVESYMEKMTADYLNVAGAVFGGKKGFSPDFVANRLWKPITGKKLKPIDLMV